MVVRKGKKEKLKKKDYYIADNITNMYNDTLLPTMLYIWYGFVQNTF